MQSKIFTKLITVEDLDLLSEEIDILLASIYKKKGYGLESALKSEVRAWFAKLLLEEINKQNLQIEDYLKSLQKELSEYKTISLILAYEPSITAIERFHAFITSYLNAKIVLDISCLPSLLAGAVIIHEGVYRDFSLKKAFYEEFNSSKEEIMKFL